MNISKKTVWFCQLVTNLIAIIAQGIATCIKTEKIPDTINLRRLSSLLQRPDAFPVILARLSQHREGVLFSESILTVLSKDYVLEDREVISHVYDFSKVEPEPDLEHISLLEGSDLQHFVRLKIWTPPMGMVVSEMIEYLQERDEVPVNIHFESIFFGQYDERSSVRDSVRKLLHQEGVGYLLLGTVFKNKHRVDSVRRIGHDRGHNHVSSSSLDDFQSGYLRVILFDQ